MFKFLYNAMANWLSKDSPPPKFPLCNFGRIRYEVRPCDVLLIEGRSRVSNIIRSVTLTSWSHSVLYIGRIHDIENPKFKALAQQYYNGPPDTQLIIEGMIGKGTIISPLSDYKEDHIRICRPRGLSPLDAQKVINHAITKLGSHYDMRQIFDLARFLILWPIFPRKWRTKLFKTHPGDATKTVCSTMIAEAFASVDFPILPELKHDEDKGLQIFHRNPKLFTPRDFDYSPYFEIIKYPFIDVEERPYRNLPWGDNEAAINDSIDLTLNKQDKTIIIDNEKNKKDKDINNDIKHNKRKQDIDFDLKHDSEDHDINIGTKTDDNYKDPDKTEEKFKSEN